MLICDKKRREHRRCSCRQQYTERHNACELYPRCRFCGSAEYNFIATHFLSAKYVKADNKYYWGVVSVQVVQVFVHSISTNIRLTKRFN